MKSSIYGIRHSGEDRKTGTAMIISGPQHSVRISGTSSGMFPALILLSISMRYLPPEEQTRLDRARAAGEVLE